MNGSSFRNFVQTFVLAPQSAKKYYVHNDTFRYLDEFLDDKCAVPVATRGSLVNGNENLNDAC